MMSLSQLNLYQKNNVSACIITKKKGLGNSYSTRPVICNEMSNEMSIGLYTVSFPLCQKTLSICDTDNGNSLDGQSVMVAQSRIHSDVDNGCKKLAHICDGRLIQVLKLYSAIPDFTLEKLRKISRANCLFVKAKRAPLEWSQRWTLRPLELIHIDVSGPTTAASDEDRKYALGILYDYSSYSTVFWGNGCSSRVQCSNISQSPNGQLDKSWFQSNSTEQQSIKAK